jgi:hypothetical protein
VLWPRGSGPAPRAIRVVHRDAGTRVGDRGGGFAGRTVTLTFKGVEASSLQTSFVVDDTALNVS